MLSTVEQIVDDLYNDLSCIKEAISTDFDTTRSSFNQIKGIFTGIKNVMPEAKKLHSQNPPDPLEPQFKKF